MEYTIKILKERLTFLSDRTSKMAETFKEQGVTDLGSIKKMNEKFTEVQNAIKILECSANTEYRQLTIPVVSSRFGEFALWLQNNRWFNYENGKWRYTFEQGTAISTANYEKNYTKTHEELYAMFCNENGY